MTVADAKEAVERVRALGGTVVSDAFEVTDVGRMAVIQDVTGATLGLWEPLRHIGATRVNDPGCLCWNDLVAEGLDAAERFYEPLFGWQVEPPEDAGGYRIVRNAGRSNGGLMPSPLLASVPAPSWLPYFNARDLDTATTSAQTGGGRVVVPPQDVPGGRMAVAQDPQGAVFGLFEGEVDD